MVAEKSTRLTLAVFKTEMKSDFNHLKEIVTDGFKKVHARQDIANGRTGKLEMGHSAIKTEVDNIEQNFVTKAEFKDGISNIKIKQIEKESNWKDKLLGFIFGIGGAFLLAFLMGKLEGK